MLLTIDAEAGRTRFGPSLAFSLVVAELVDLAVAGRITLRGELIHVLDSHPIGDVLADDSLARLAHTEGEPITVEQWLSRRRIGRIGSYLAGLQNAEIIRAAHPASDEPVWVADPERATAPTRRLRALTQQGGDPTVQDVAFAALARSSGWPQARLCGRKHRHERARLNHLAAMARKPRDGDPSWAILSHGMRATANLALPSDFFTAEDGIDHGDHGSSSRGYVPSEDRRGLRVVVGIVALLALATLVLAGLTNLDLTIIITPFTLPLIVLPCIDHNERRDRRRAAAQQAPPDTR